MTRHPTSAGRPRRRKRDEPADLVYDLIARARRSPSPPWRSPDAKAPANQAFDHLGAVGAFAIQSANGEN
jgi:hypothetical protein